MRLFWNCLHIVVFAVAAAHDFLSNVRIPLFRHRTHELLGGDEFTPSSFSITNEQSSQRKMIASFFQRNLLQSTVDFLRHLQKNTSVTSVSPTPAPVSRFCSSNGNGVVFPDDDFNILAFKSQFEPVCVCYEDNNTEETFADIGGSNASEFINNLNAAFLNVRAVIEYDCVNTCANCFNEEEFCGILQTSESSLLQGTEGNFTVEELRNGEITEASFERLLGESSFSITTCFNYTKGETGRLCYGGNFNLSTTPSCFVQHNDILCNSCTFPNDPFVDEANSDCFIADCTNVGAKSLIDTCNGTGYEAAFRFLALSEGEAGNTTVTLGSCDEPTAAPIETQLTTLGPLESAAATLVFTTRMWTIVGIVHLVMF
jgi:hypothetical protein